MSQDPETVAEKAVGPPDTVGPFRLEQVLGRGGMGVVYRATAPDGTIVALKVMRPTVADEAMTMRFQREARIRLDHPNVIRVIDAGVSNDMPYIAFELLEGETLGARLRHGPLSVDEAVSISRQICRGLAAAHEAGIVHRDMKPGNVFLCADGTVKLLDFGIAHLTFSETQLTMEGSVLGTPGYLAPEQARGEAVVDARTDIWAVGVLVYRMVSGRSPFERGTAVATMLAVVLDDPTPLTDIVPGLPVQLWTTVERCLAKPTDSRWPSAAALDAALAELDLTPSPNEQPRSVDALPTLPPDEQRVVAVLFAEGVLEIEAVRAAVEQWGGALVPLRGSHAIGLFGGHRSEGDEAARAVGAALQARGAADWLAVASGHAARTGAAVSGDAVEAAERASARHLGGVAVDAEAARALVGRFAMQQVSERLFEVTADLSITKTQHTWSEALFGGELPILGRDSELAQMRSALDTLLEERRALAVVISGPAGIGKTRLRFEMERLLAEASEPINVLVGNAEPHARAAFSLFGSVLSAKAGPGAQYLHERGTNVPTQKRRDVILDIVRSAVADTERVRDCADALGELLGVASQDASPERRHDPQVMADRIRVAIGDFVAGMLSRGPTALVVEDVQWADEASVDLLQELVDRHVDEPLLLLATTRPDMDESRGPLFAGRDVVLIQPRRLAPSHVGLLARNIVGRDLSEQLAKIISERTDGNPFFVEQVVRKLKEENLVDAELSELPIPLTVEAAVQSRLDHLPRMEKELLKRAAVLGDSFSPDGLAELGVPEPRVLLASLGKRGLVASRAGQRPGGSREYHFRSALVAEVAYRMNSEPRRQELHKRAAHFLTTWADADPEEIAHHYDRGGEAGLAADQYASAAFAAARRGDTQGVLRCADKALELGASSSRCALHMVRADSVAFLGRRDDQERDLAAALETASGDAQRARVLTQKAELLSATGRTEEALVVAAEGIEHARRSEDADVLVRALTRHASALIYAGKLAQAETELAEAARREDDATPETRALVAAWRAQLATARGDLGDRRAAYVDAIARYRDAGDVRRAATAECNLADTYNRVGAYSEAEAALRGALDACRRVGNRGVEGYALANLGYSLTMLGRRGEALETFAEAERVAHATREARLAVIVRVYRARALLAGAPDVAALSVIATEAEEAAHEATRVGVPAVCALALAVASNARLRMSDAAGALELSKRAMTLRDELGSIEEDEADVFLAHARALEASGEGDRARETLALGRSRLEEIAARVRDADLRERFLRDVPAHRELMSRES